MGWCCLLDNMPPHIRTALLSNVLVYLSLLTVTVNLVLLRREVSTCRRLVSGDRLDLGVLEDATAGVRYRDQARRLSLIRLV